MTKPNSEKAQCQKVDIAGADAVQSAKINGRHIPTIMPEFITDLSPDLRIDLALSSV